MNFLRDRGVEEWSKPRYPGQEYWSSVGSTGADLEGRSYSTGYMPGALLFDYNALEGHMVLAGSEGRNNGDRRVS